MAPVRPLLAESVRTSARPSTGRSGRASGMRPSTTFTAPPIAPEP